LDGLSFGPREINEMISVLQRYEAHEKVFIISLMDNGLDEEIVNLLLQLIYTLPYLRRIDLRRNCISEAGIKRMEEQLRSMEGVTSINKSVDQVINVHSGNQLRLSVDVSEQVPRDQVTKEVDFSVQQDLSHQDADVFLASDPGSTAQHPWTKAPQAQRSPQVAMPDPSATELPKPRAAPPPPAIGGPPVGLGGPGNVAALNKKAVKGPKEKMGAKEPKKRQARRAKAAPPPALDCQPSAQASRGFIEKCQAANVPVYGGDSVYACSSSRRSSGGNDHRGVVHVPSGYIRTTPHPSEREQSPSLDRSSSLPTLRRGVASWTSYANARVP
jgi:hypothetical protein